MTRTTGKQYRKQLQDLKEEKKALEARIVKRAKELCKQCPDIWILLSGHCNGNLTGDFVKVTKLHVITALGLIEIIEKELADKHPHKQTEIKF